MLGRAIGALVVIAACALPVSAQGRDRADVPGAQPLSWDGAACRSDDECRSRRCASHWNGVRYCIRADLACAFPGSAGVMPGFTSTSDGVTHVCRLGGDWLSTKRAVVARRKATPVIPPAGSKTALNGAADLLQTATKAER
jgi:hypothetical protein